MPCATIVPKGDGAWRPLKAGGVPIAQHGRIDNHSGLLRRCPAVKMQRKTGLTRLAPAFRVRDDHRMHGVLCGIFGV